MAYVCPGLAIFTEAAGTGALKAGHHFTRLIPGLVVAGVVTLHLFSKTVE